MAETQPKINEFKIANPTLEGNPTTYLTADVAAAATALATIDNTGFTLTGTSDYYILVGGYGTQKSEITLVDADGGGTTNTGFTVGALKYSHEASDPVVFIRYNQIKFYGATTSGGTKVPIATIDIDPSEQFTEYVYEGATYTYFYIAYYNSTSEKLSEYSDEINNASYTRRSAKRIIDAGLRKALTKIDESQSSVLNWDVALEILQDGIDEILTRKRKWSFLRKRSESGTTTSGTASIAKPTDLVQLNFLMINGVKIDWISHLDYNRYTQTGETAITGAPTNYTEKNNLYYLYPTPNAAYNIIYEYYKTPAVITSNLSTEIDLPFVPVLIHYCAAHFAYIRGNDKRGDKMYTLFQNLLEQQVIEYSGPDQAGDAEYIERTSGYGQDYDDSYILMN